MHAVGPTGACCFRSGVSMLFACLRIKPLFVVAALVAPGLLLSTTWAGDGKAQERVLPAVATLPVGKAEVVAIGEGHGVDRQPTLAVLPDGGFVLVYANYARGDIASSGLRVVTSSDGRTLSASDALGFGGDVEDAPSLVSIRDGTWLYFSSGDRALGNLQVWRSRLVGTAFSSPEPLVDVPGLRRLTQWPRWVDAGQDVFLTYIGNPQPLWLRMGDGVTPQPPVSLAPFAVAYPRVVPMAGGGCFFSYQKPPEGGYMATYYSVSADCRHWSPPAALSWREPPHKPDIHDAYALPRQDAGVDVYYVYPSRKGTGARVAVGFDLYRRAVMADGRLGPEQALTERDALYPFAPTAHRLPDGTILVTFSDIHARGDHGVSSARLMAFKLAADAPAPVR